MRRRWLVATRRFERRNGKLFVALLDYEPKEMARPVVRPSALAFVSGSCVPVAGLWKLGLRCAWSGDRRIVHASVSTRRYARTVQRTHRGV